jgi:hypothetical protein
MFNITQLTKNIDDYETNKVCAIVVAAKYFGNNQSVIRLCMQNLSKRRDNGDSFNFEEYIEAEYNKLPHFNKKSFDAQDIMKGIKTII